MPDKSALYLCVLVTKIFCHKTKKELLRYQLINWGNSQLLKADPFGFQKCLYTGLPAYSSRNRVGKSSLNLS